MIAAARGGIIIVSLIAAISMGMAAHKLIGPMAERTNAEMFFFGAFCVEEITKGGVMKLTKAFVGQTSCYKQYAVSINKQVVDIRIFQIFPKFISSKSSGWEYYLGVLRSLSLHAGGSIQLEISPRNTVLVLDDAVDGIFDIKDEIVSRLSPGILIVDDSFKLAALFNFPFQFGVDWANPCPLGGEQSLSRSRCTLNGGFGLFFCRTSKYLVGINEFFRLGGLRMDFYPLKATDDGIDYSSYHHNESQTSNYFGGIGDRSVALRFIGMALIVFGLIFGDRAGVLSVHNFGSKKFCISVILGISIAVVGTLFVIASVW